jgi:hypothetical protein
MSKYNTSSQGLIEAFPATALPCQAYFKLGPCPFKTTNGFLNESVGSRRLCYEICSLSNSYYLMLYSPPSWHHRISFQFALSIDSAVNKSTTNKKGTPQQRESAAL